MFHYALNCATGSGLAEPLLCAYYKVGGFMFVFEGLRERTGHLDIFLFPPITQWCSISDVLFTGGGE